MSPTLMRLLEQVFFNLAGTPFLSYDYTSLLALPFTSAIYEGLSTNSRLC